MESELAIFSSQAMFPVVESCGLTKRSVLLLGKNVILLKLTVVLLW